MMDKPDGLYFIQEGANGSIKIGRTRSPTSRIVRFQTGNPRKLRFLHFEEGAGWQEAFWQVLFSDYHIRGEWFEPRPPLRMAIRLLAAGADWATCAEVHPMDEHDPATYPDYVRRAFAEYTYRVRSLREFDARAAIECLNAPEDAL